MVQDRGACKADAFYAVMLLAVLCVTITSILCMFAFFREDKEEQITPLCPQLVVRENELNISLSFEDPGDEVLVKDQGGRVRCKAVTDWPDPFRLGASGVAATVRLHNDLGTDLLATVVARNIAVPGQGLALCKSGCEIFGFIEPEPPLQPKRYFVRHRSGVHLLTLIGDFGAYDIDAVNPAGSVVCSYKAVNNEVSARVCQHVDAGLMLCALLAMRVHRQLIVAAPSQPVPVGRPVLGQLAAPSDSASGPAASAQELGGNDPLDSGAAAGGIAGAAPDAPAEVADLAVGVDSTGAATAPPVFRGKVEDTAPPPVFHGKEEDSASPAAATDLAGESPPASARDSEGPAQVSSCVGDAAKGSFTA